jgi:hypothetical protein
VSELGTVERAFQIARKTQAPNVTEIRKQLEREGYQGAGGHLNGPAIKKQLVDAIAERKKQAEASRSK